MQGEHPAKKIKFLLRTCQMSFQDLADRTGMTLEALRDFLDERAVPPPSLLRRIAAALGAKEAFLGVSEGAGAPPEHAPRGSLPPGPAGKRST
ncbi:MAG: helix-turn-helix domain-containing protein, partial [Planctomycetota bacterium]